MRGADRRDDLLVRRVPQCDRRLWLQRLQRRSSCGVAIPRRALTYTRDISPQERLYKDAVSDLGVVNEHAYWARVGEPVLNFLPGAPGLVVNIKDAITGGSQMGQATASFLNDGPNADSAGRFLEGFLNAAGAVAGTHWGYKDGVTPSGSYSPPWQNSTIVPEKEMATVSASAIGLKWGEGNMKQGMPWGIMWAPLFRQTPDYRKTSERLITMTMLLKQR